MIKLIIFDLDGVLVDTRDLHYESLNLALADYYINIPYDEHLAKYNGHPTKYKLDLLTKEKGLDPHFHEQIWKRKQELTQELLKTTIRPNPAIIEMLSSLSKTYKIYVASNSIWVTIKNSLLFANILEYVDYFVSCEEVKHPKPSPEIYLKALQHANVGPHEALICEDSPIGISSAQASGAHVLPVSCPEDISLTSIKQTISQIYSPQKTIIPKTKINIVIPMAGYGSRFAKAGYQLPKPLIDVCGKPMIQRVVQNIGIDGQFIFIVQREHYHTYHLQIVLSAIAPGCKIVCLDGVTEGAACSVLAAKPFIDNDTNLLIANSDQYLEWSPHEFLYCAQNVDACISTFQSDSPKFSFAQVDGTGNVAHVAEKEVISPNATTGIYFWKHVQDHKKITILDCDKFWCLGTPEDLQHFVSIKSDKI
jgi:HAD superfamily hydrolase (TIGR01509 family)